ncbi:hypothetical protein [Thomasclavelia sp.]
MTNEEKIIEIIEAIYEKYSLSVTACKIKASNIKNYNVLRKYNLKNKKVKHVIDDITDININSTEDVFDFEFLELLKLYNTHLVYFTLMFNFRLDESKFEYAQRIKADNSIFSKLATYRTSVRHQFGEIPLNKCINDLFGMRIIVKNGNIDYNIIENYCNMHVPKIKFINSSKFDYHAYHVYFRIDNFSFPWELQIWEKKYEQSNRDSHAKHKQDYVQWESVIQKYKEVD